MRRFVCSTLLLVTLAGLSGPARAAAPSDQANLAGRLDAIVERLAPPESQVGVSVVALASGQRLYARQADKAFVPASLQKLLTATAALSEFGAERRFSTLVLADSPLDKGTLRGSLYLRGEGDPSLEASDLDAFATQLAAAGLRVIAGDLVLDAGAFQPEGPAGSGWAWDDLPWGYGAPVSALSLHENRIEIGVAPGPRPGAPLTLSLTPASSYLQLRTQGNTLAPGSAPTLDVSSLPASGHQEVWKLSGGLPVGAPADTLERSVANPPRFVGAVFAEALARRGIALKGAVRVGAAPTSPKTRTLATHQSAPVGDLVRAMSKSSDNFLAETLLFQLGAQRQGFPATWAKGLAALRAHVERAGWKPNAYRLVDGSGLSRYNAYSPAQLTQLLAQLPRTPLPYAGLLVSLPVGGVDGTLSGRLNEAGVRGRVRAKTGTMSAISGLAGYVTSPRGETYAVAVMVNGFLGGPARSRELQDALVAALLAAE